MVSIHRKLRTIVQSGLGVRIIQNVKAMRLFVQENLEIAALGGLETLLILFQQR